MKENVQSSKTIIQSSLKKKKIRLSSSHCILPRQIGFFSSPVNLSRFLQLFHKKNQQTHKRVGEQKRKAVKVSLIRAYFLLHSSYIDFRRTAATNEKLNC